MCSYSFKKRCYGNFVLLIHRIIELFTREACTFLTKKPIFNIIKTKICYHLKPLVYFSMCRRIDQPIFKSALVYLLSNINNNKH